MTFIGMAVFAAGCQEEQLSTSHTRLELSENAIVLPSDPTTVQVDIFTDDEWYVDTVRSNNINYLDQWLSVDPRSGNGNATINLTALPNTGDTRGVYVQIRTRRYFPSIAAITVMQYKAGQ